MRRLGQRHLETCQGMPPVSSHTSLNQLKVLLSYLCLTRRSTGARKQCGFKIRRRCRARLALKCVYLVIIAYALGSFCGIYSYPASVKYQSCIRVLPWQRVQDFGRLPAQVGQPCLLLLLYLVYLLHLVYLVIGIVAGNGPYAGRFDAEGGRGRGRIFEFGSAGQKQPD